MSADNYYVIYRLAPKKYVPVMYFASDDETLHSVKDADECMDQFSSLQEAVKYCEDDYTEYGYIITPECWEDE